MLIGIASKSFTKGHPKTRKNANFDNIKGNVNEMKLLTKQKKILMQNKNKMK
jgi:hypothetical protein